MGVHGLVDNEWIDVESLESENDVDGIRDFIDVSIDPKDPKHVMFASWEEGLIELRDGEMVEIYNQTNSTLQEAFFGSGPRIGVGGVDYDHRGNLWFTNSFTESPLQVMLANGDFVEMSLGNAVSTNDNIGGVKCTRDGYVWVLLPRGNGALVYDTGDTQINLRR